MRVIHAPEFTTAEILPPPLLDLKIMCSFVIEIADFESDFLFTTNPLILRNHLFSTMHFVDKDIEGHEEQRHQIRDYHNHSVHIENPSKTLSKFSKALKTVKPLKPSKPQKHLKILTFMKSKGTPMLFGKIFLERFQMFLL